MRKFAYLWSILLIFAVFANCFAQDNSEIESKTRRLAAMLRIKSDLIHLKEPVFYLGFQNSDESFSAIEEALEEDFLRKFCGVVVCSVHEDKICNEKFDKLEINFEDVSEKELALIIENLTDFRYILLGQLQKNQNDDQISVEVKLYELSTHKDLAACSVNLKMSKSQ